MHNNRQETTSCIPLDPTDTVTDRLNQALSSGGAGYILTLCPSAQYVTQAPIKFTAADQEISTFGYPEGNERATIVVNGPIASGTGHTTAVDGSCSTCGGIKIRNIQINGNRAGSSESSGGGNIEIGGNNSDQLVEYVRSYDPRGWTCLHVAGGMQCSNVTIQRSDIGPCGSDEFQQWADGISVSCRASTVRDNVISDPTDGGIVIFGAPGTEVHNNTISVRNSTLLGGINLVDYLPFNGDYTNTRVYNNTILGGFATGTEQSGDTLGSNANSAIIKIGIAIGPRTWFGDNFGSSENFNGYVHDNQLSGAFSYGIAITSARNFSVRDNVLIDNADFIGARGPNCSTSDSVPSPAPFIVDRNTTESLDLQDDFVDVSDGDSLTCVLPPNGGDFWPFNDHPYSPYIAPRPRTHLSPAQKAGVAVGVVAAFVVFCAAVFFIRRWAVRRQLSWADVRSSIYRRSYRSVARDPKMF